MILLIQSDFIKCLLSCQLLSVRHDPSPRPSTVYMLMLSFRNEKNFTRSFIHLISYLFLFTYSLFIDFIPRHQHCFLNSSYCEKRHVLYTQKRKHMNTHMKIYSLPCLSLQACHLVWRWASMLAVWRSTDRPRAKPSHCPIGVT